MFFCNFACMLKLCKMKKLYILFLALSLFFLSCVPELHLQTKQSKIVDITYDYRVTYVNNVGWVGKTKAYFVLEDGHIIPMPDNFNPSSLEQYVGKTITYDYWGKVEQRSNFTPPEGASSEGYKYICYKKYITSDNKCMIRYYTKTSNAIKTVQVSTEVYEHAKEGYYIETEEIEPFIQLKK